MPGVGEIRGSNENSFPGENIENLWGLKGAIS